MKNTDYSIFDKMIEGVQVISKDWRYIYVNDTVAKQGKTTREELLGHTMMEKYPGIKNTKLFKYIQKCMNNRMPCKFTNRFTFPDDSTGWFDLRMEPVEDGVFIMSFDITARKLLENELRLLNVTLEQKVLERTIDLNKSLEREKKLNDIKSTFVSLVSHEFRTPLSTILSSTNLAEKYTKTEQQDKRVKHFDRIKSSVKHLTIIMDEFLSLEKISQGKMTLKEEIFNLQKFLENIILELNEIRKEEQQINYTHKGEKEVALDKKILHNIMLNLLSNAIKYSDEQIDLITELNGQQIITLIVQDRGIGIPKEEQEKLFEQFFRASNAEKIQGTGLGLNIVKRYVDLLNGSINFTSQENKGTTFEVKIPNNLEDKAAS